MQSESMLRLVFFVALIAGCFAIPSGCSDRVQKDAENIRDDAAQSGSPGGDASSGTGGRGGTGGSGGTGATGGSAGASGTAGTDAATGETGGGDLSCVQGVLAETATASTDSAGNRFSTSCGSGTAPDIAFEWTAPLADYYAFDTRGSSFDTVLAVLDADCAGAELGCNNNAGSSQQSEVVVRLVQGQRVIVVVDGQLGAKGAVTVHANRVTCPDSDLTDQPFPARLSTVGGKNQRDGPCGGGMHSEKTVRWVAKTAGLYQFSAASSAFSPALYLERGVVCGGELLQCNYSVKGGHPAQLARWLEADQDVTVTIDSRDTEGEFTLDIAKLGAACPSKPKLTATLSNVVLDDTSGAKLLSPSCNWAGNMSGTVPHPYPEHSYPVHVQLPNLQYCTYHIEGDGPYQAYLIRGSKCEGAELRCLTPDANGYVDEIFATADNGDYVLAIENQHPFGGPLTYSLSTNCP